MKRLSATALLYVALMLLVVPLQWIGAAGLAAAFHELCHRILLYWFGIRNIDLETDLSGMKMYLPSMSAWKELICTLAGPIGGLLLFLLGRWLPRVAFCAAVQSCVNLLPIYPLDGGRALRCLLSMGCSPGVSEKIAEVMGSLSKIALLGFSIYASLVLHLGLFPMLLCLLLLIRIK